MTTVNLQHTPGGPAIPRLATTRCAIVIGGGPAGLMAAHELATAGLQVDLYDAMPSVGRKFLLAGKGGLNLTHSEPHPLFVTRFGAAGPALRSLLDDFSAVQVRAWAQGLGIDTFVGTSGRVFPSDMKAAPLLRAWLHRLRAAGVRFHMRHRWTAWAPSLVPHGPAGVCFDAPAGAVSAHADVVVLALGGGSWPQLGSNGLWVPLLGQALAGLGAAAGPGAGDGKVAPPGVAPLVPSNCGFDVAGWSVHFASRFAGHPFKAVAIRVLARDGRTFARKGEFVATATGVEGSLIYAASPMLRDDIASHGSAVFELDLLPHFSADKVLAEVTHPRGSRSLSAHLKSRLGLDGIKSAILHELLPRDAFAQPQVLAQAIKALPVRVVATRPLAEAISSAGGVRFDGLTADLMLRAMPGVFCAGEMLDWEAPTGGYLLNACLASGVRAGRGAAQWLAPSSASVP